MCLITLSARPKMAPGPYGWHPAIRSWTESTWRQHQNHQHLPCVRQWRHLPDRRTAESSWLSGVVDVLFWPLLSGFLDIIRRFRSPPFDPAVTRQCGDPAKMKWMFKEDHSLGKGVWIVMKREILSCHAPSVLCLSLRIHCCHLIPYRCRNVLLASAYKSMMADAAWLATNAKIILASVMTAVKIRLTFQYPWCIQSILPWNVFFHCMHVLNQSAFKNPTI